jgi:hypothetical protein
MGAQALAAGFAGVEQYLAAVEAGALPEDEHDREEAPQTQAKRARRRTRGKTGSTH